jgi:hypothetical protein
MFRTQPTNFVGIAKLAFCNWLYIFGWRGRVAIAHIQSLWHKTLTA